MHSSSDALVVLDASNPRHLARALDDIASGLGRWRLAWRLALLDLRNRYRGSALGPLWVTLSMGLMITGPGILYAQLFRIDVTLYLPHLAVSLIVWNWIAGSLNESCVAFTSSEAIIRQVRMPYSVYVLRSVLRNMLTAGAQPADHLCRAPDLLTHFGARRPAGVGRHRPHHRQRRRRRLLSRHALRPLSRRAADHRERRPVVVLPYARAVEGGAARPACRRHSVGCALNNGGMEQGANLPGGAAYPAGGMRAIVALLT